MSSKEEYLVQCKASQKEAGLKLEPTDLLAQVHFIPPVYNFKISVVSFYVIRKYFKILEFSLRSEVSP